MRTIILTIVLFLALSTNQFVYGKTNSLYSLPQTSCNITLSDTIEWCEGGLQGFWLTGAQLPNQVRISDVWGDDTTFTLNSNYIPYTLFFPYVDNNGQSYLQITDLVNNCFDVFLVQPGIVDILPVYFLTNNVNTTPASCGLSNGQITGMRVSPGSFNAGKWYDSEGNVMPSTPMYNNSCGCIQYDLNNVAAGTYVFIYESDCDYFETTATVGEQALLFDTIFNTLQIYTDYCNPCASGAMIQQQPYYSTAWSTGATGFTTGFICPGDYSITLTYNNFETQATCSQTRNFTIDVPDTSVQIIGGTPSNVCGLPCQSQITDVIVANGTPPYQYLWSDGQTTLNAANLCEGLATLNVRDAHNCIVTKTYTITSPTIQPISANLGFCNQTISATATGGTTPYQYTWSDGSTNTLINNPQNNQNYQLTITDGNGCVKIDTIYINNNTALQSSTSATKSASCVCTSMLNTVPTGGMPPYTYQWADGSTQANINNACSNQTYLVTITDAYGCVKIDSVTTPEETLALDVHLDGIIPTFYCDCHGMIYLDVYSLEAGVSLDSVIFSTNDSFMPSDGLLFFGNLCEGNYPLTLVDNFGCHYDMNFTMYEELPNCNDNNPNTIDLFNNITCSCYHEIVGIETANSLNIAITPNPARNYLNVLVNSSALLELYNITGLMVLQQELSVGEQQIETNNLPDGIYICQIKTNKQVLNRQKVVLLRQ